MIDSLITRPVLRVTTWVKRHWVAALIIVALLFIVPPLFVVISMVLGKALEIFRAILTALKFSTEAADKIANAVASYVNKFLDWLGKSESRCYWLALGVGLFAPLVGATLALWCFLDRFKKGPMLEAVPSPSPGPEFGPENDPELGRIFNGDIDGVDATDEFSVIV